MHGEMTQGVKKLEITGLLEIRLTNKLRQKPSVTEVTIA